MSGVERVVRLGSMAYIDPKGRHLRADCGQTVLVHPDNVERFDRLNVLQGQTQEDAPPSGAESRSAKGAAKPRVSTARKED